ncbi:hypothetical protein AAMO2058_001702000 [Amorphochlora amoebiformis]
MALKCGMRGFTNQIVNLKMVMNSKQLKDSLKYDERQKKLLDDHDMNAFSNSELRTVDKRKSRHGHEHRDQSSKSDTWNQIYQSRDRYCSRDRSRKVTYITDVTIPKSKSQPKPKQRSQPKPRPVPSPRPKWQPRATWQYRRTTWQSRPRPKIGFQLRFFGVGIKKLHSERLNSN